MFNLGRPRFLGTIGIKGSGSGGRFLCLSVTPTVAGGLIIII